MLLPYEHIRDDQNKKTDVLPEYGCKATAERTARARNITKKQAQTEGTDLGSIPLCSCFTSSHFSHSVVAPAVLILGPTNEL